MAEKNRKITPFEQEMVDTAKQVMEYKMATEANIVANVVRIRKIS